MINLFIIMILFYNIYTLLNYHDSSIKGRFFIRDILGYLYDVILYTFILYYGYLDQLINILIVIYLYS